MFLLKTTVEMIAKNWKVFRWAIESAFPPTHTPSDAVMNDILQQLMAGRMQLWVAHKKQFAPIESVGVLTTSIMRDQLTNEKRLLFFSVFAWQAVPDEMWMDGYKTITTYALSEGCKKIEFYTIKD